MHEFNDEDTDNVPGLFVKCETEKAEASIGFITQIGWSECAHLCYWFLNFNATFYYIRIKPNREVFDHFSKTFSKNCPTEVIFIPLESANGYLSNGINSCIVRYCIYILVLFLKFVIGRWNGCNST